MSLSLDHSSLDYPELCIALVGAVGIDLSEVVELLADGLRQSSYIPKEILLSELLDNVPKFDALKSGEFNSDYDRIDAYMTAGTEFRELMETGDAFIHLALAKIHEIRKNVTQDHKKPLNNHGIILKSLKHPQEVDALRKIYGDRCFVVSIFEDKLKRTENLKERIANSNQQLADDVHTTLAKKLIERDENEGKDLGQNVGECFHRADFFINSAKNIKMQIDRFLDLLFGKPFVTPSMDEFGIFLAHSVALRSADLSRQVGAVITTKKGELVASGCNEVPQIGGGAYWEGTSNEDDDARDFIKKSDPNALMKHEIVTEIFSALQEKGWLDQKHQNIDAKKLTEEALLSNSHFLEDKKVAGLLEFGRVVHAEMFAITEAAKRGNALDDTILYCTTFPCHNCSRHILAAGIDRVVYIEPYPKSITSQLYSKLIRTDGDGDQNSETLKFDPFSGLSPNNFFRFFKKGRRKTNKGLAVANRRLKKPIGVSMQRPDYDLEDGYIKLLKSKHII